MKKIILSFIFLSILCLSGCTIDFTDKTENLLKEKNIQTELLKNKNSDSIIGTWENTDINDESVYIVFNGDKTVSFKDINKNLVSMGDSILRLEYEIIEEVNPHQLYINITSKNTETETVRMPFGIYKIENDSLIIRDAIIYDRYLGGINMGTSRTEMPTDFNGILRKYKRIKE